MNETFSTPTPIPTATTAATAATATTATRRGCPIRTDSTASHALLLKGFYAGIE
jgi:hypothetical protein